jgi:hypothetical protein
MRTFPSLNISLLTYFLPLLGIFALISCQADLEVPLPKHEEKLVVFAYLKAGDPLDIYVYRSQGVGTNDALENYIVEDAIVELFRDGELIDTLYFQNTPILDTIGIDIIGGDTLYNERTYEGAKYTPHAHVKLPEIGELYSVRVTHPAYNSVEAETIIQPEPNISRIHLGIDSIITYDLNGGVPRIWTALYTSIDDVNPNPNYYHFFFELEYERRAEIDGQIQLDTFVSRRWADMNIERALEGYYYGESYPLSDDGFNGTSGELLSFLYMPKQEELILSPGNPILATNRPLRMNIFAFLLSEAYGEYQQALYLQRNGRASGIGLDNIFFNSEPVTLTGNIKGGYGMFGSMNFTVLEVDSIFFQ